VPGIFLPRRRLGRAGKKATTIPQRCLEKAKIDAACDALMR